MPNYKGHLAGGFVLYAVIFFCFLRVLHPSAATAIEWLLCLLAGALFPDVDIKSKGQKYFYYVVFLFFIFLALRGQLQMLACCSFVVMTPMLVRHRGVFHSPRFVIAMPLVFWVLMSSVMPRQAGQLFNDVIFFIIGALSHIWLDFGLRQMLRRLLHRKKY